MSKADTVKMTQAEEFAEQRYQDGLAEGKAQRNALLEAAKRVSANWGHRCGGDHLPDECSLCQLLAAIVACEKP